MENSDLRKRIAKACDNCRLRKTKCDGKTPCGRCGAEDEICTFGTHMKLGNGIYPQGYVEKLLKDRERLVNLVQELYQRIEDHNGWKALLPVKLVGKLPHVHSILSDLGVLPSNEKIGNSADSKEVDAPSEPTFGRAFKVDKSPHTRECAHLTSQPGTPHSKDYKKPTDVDPRATQDVDSCQVYGRSAPLPSTPMNDSNTSVQITTQDKIQPDQDQDLFVQHRGWNLNDTQASQTEQHLPFLHMPRSSKFISPSTSGQIPPSQYNSHVQQSPLYPQQSPTTQLEGQLDYFSGGLDGSTDVSSALQFFADIDMMLEENLFYWENPGIDGEGLCN